jgi:acetyl-CoA carboxylase biotin carboxyl carrier protein
MRIAMDSQHMKAAIDAMAASNLTEMELSHEGWTLRLKRNVVKGPGLVTARPQTATQPQAHTIQAPVFGIVHLQASPGQPPFVQVGETVQAGQTLCTIEAMKVFNEVCTEQAGRVVEVRVKTGAEVEAGQALFVVKSDRHV